MNFVLENLLIVSASPHIRCPRTTAWVMRNVVIALIPALAAAVILFGPRALLLTLFCITCCVGFEAAFCWITKKETNTTRDFSAVVTGVLLAFNLPVNLPLWMAAVGCFFAIVITKELFGGLGQNFANPALVGRIVLMVSFTGRMTSFSAPFLYSQTFVTADQISSATPLALAGTEEAASYLDLFLGNYAGCIGEVSALALLLGGIYLILRKIISPIIPAVYIATVFLLTTLFGGDGLYQILSGGLMLGAIFMATDYSTSPMTKMGKVIFAIGCGLITAVIRMFGSYAEGVSFAILLMNIATPLIDRAVRTHPLGGVNK